MSSFTPELVTSAALRRLLASEKVQLVDVREPDEWEAGHIDGASHIPLGELPDRLSELDPSSYTVCYCRMGGRSARACAMLVGAGFARVGNLEGGITAFDGAEA